jgi:hypothetical protein
VVSVFGGVQPDIVPLLHSESQVRDGWVERLLPYVPMLPPKVFTYEDDISTEAYAGISSLFRAIDRLPFANEDDDTGNPAGIGVHMSVEARKIWKRWSDENNALADQEQGFLGGFYTKLEAYVARFALILHILEHAYGDPRVMLSKETMEGAIELGEFFRDQIRLFVPLLNAGIQTSNKGAGLMGRIVRLIRRKGEEWDVPNNEETNHRTIEKRICVRAEQLYKGLGNVRKEYIYNELDTYNDSKRVDVYTIPTGNNPTRLFCLSDENI